MIRRRAAGRRLMQGVGAGAARLAMRRLQQRPPGGADRWQRTNHRGEPVTLLEGPALVAGTVAAVAVARGIPARTRAAAAVAAAGAGAFGAVDDLAESVLGAGSGAGKSKGLRGHLGELAHGRLTTGGLKVLGIGATGLAAAALALADRERGAGREQPAADQAAGAAPGAGRPAGRAFDVVTSGALIAGSANLVNLLDLRPGRALKAVLLSAPFGTAPGPAGALVTSVTAPAGALLPDDLAERSMLGDTGANAAGAVLGTAIVAGAGRRARLAALAAIIGLTLASEKVSFTRVIESTPGLRQLDRLGRRPL